MIELFKKSFQLWNFLGMGGKDEKAKEAEKKFNSAIKFFEKQNFFYLFLAYCLVSFISVSIALIFDFSEETFVLSNLLIIGILVLLFVLFGFFIVYSIYFLFAKLFGGKGNYINYLKVTLGANLPLYLVSFLPFIGILGVFTWLFTNAGVMKLKGSRLALSIIVPLVILMFVVLVFAILIGIILSSTYSSPYYY